MENDKDNLIIINLLKTFKNLKKLKVLPIKNK
jgi:hypothetical protein